MLRRRLMNVARFARSAPTPCYQRDNAPPFASVPLFPDVFACTPRFLLSSPFFLSPPLLSIWKTRPEGETTRLCDECNYARRGTKVSWRKYASVPLLFRILDRLSEDLFFGNWSISQQSFLGWNRGLRLKSRDERKLESFLIWIFLSNRKEK